MRESVLVLASVLMLATATVGYGAGYTTDFEDGTIDGWYTGGHRWAIVTDGVGVGGTKGLDGARTDGPTLYLTAGLLGGGADNFIGNLQAKYGDEFHISCAMQDGDDGSPDLVKIELVNHWIDGKWSRTWPTPLSEAAFTTYDTGLMDATWTDAQAIAAGWTKVGTGGWVGTVIDIKTLLIYTDGPGANFEWLLIDRSFTDNITIETMPIPELGTVITIQ